MAECLGEGAGDLLAIQALSDSNYTSSVVWSKFKNLPVENSKFSQDITFQPQPPSTKVPAVDVKRALNAGPKAGPGCAKKQRVDPRQANNAERDCHRQFVRMGYSLPIPIQEIVHETESGPITTHWVKVTSYFAHFLKRAPYLLCGGSGEDLRYRLKCFWAAFRCHHPDHEVYTRHSNDLDCTIPFCFHGDEGKGPKRSNFMDFAVETPLGLFLQDDYFTCTCCDEIMQCQRYLVPQPKQPVEEVGWDTECCVRSMTHNATGHSYLKRYLVFGLPHAWYKEGRDHILNKHLQLAVEDACDFFENGVEVNGTTYFGAYLGLKGDLKFHKEVTLGLSRSYANMGRRRDLMMCSLCWAGLPQFPFEEVDEVPAWSTTEFRDRPWIGNPVLTGLPFDQQKPEFALKLDPFHVMKVGFSRDVVGSVILTLCRLGYFDFEDEGTKAIPDRLKRAFGAFKLYCAGEHRSPACRSFTKAFFNCKTSNQSPWANAKGSDVSLMLRWLTFFVPVLLAQGDFKDHGHKILLKVMNKLMEDIRTFHGICQSHGLFLDRPCGQRLHQLIMMIGKSYHWLARQVLSLHIVGFSVKPKYHCLKHIAFQLRRELESSSKFIWNPLGYNCEGNEDHVGRVCKLGRSVSTRTISKRVIQRYFLKTKALIRRHRDSLN